MKFDSESPYHLTCPSHENDTKVLIHSDPFVFAKDNHFMIDALDIDTEEKDSLIQTPPIEKKSFKVSSPARQFLNLEDTLHRNGNNDEFMDNPFSAPPSGFKMVVKADFYTDKIVPEVEASQMNDCTEDDPFHPVKDISVDKEIQCSDRNVVERESVGQMGSYVSSQSLHNLHNDLTGEKAGSIGAYDLKCTVFDSLLVTIDEDQVDPASVLHDDLDRNATFLCSFDSGVLDRSASMIADTSANVFEPPADHVSVSDNVSDGKGSFVSSIDSDSKAHAPGSVVSNIPSEVTGSTGFPYSDIHNDCDGKSSSATSIDRRKVDTTGSVVNINYADVTENRLLPLSQEITTDSSTGDISSLKFLNDQRHSVDEQKCQDISEEYNNTMSTSLSFRSEVPENNESKEITADCKVSGGVITFSFDREVASTSGGEENKETASSLRSEVVKNGSGTEDAVFGCPTASSKCSFRHHMQGEPNLSGSDILSGPIANSGHIPYSGSISIRSDSSTTSARSFAFPILQSEWNSSPVKMAKADRRRLRKNRGWRVGLLCCRF